jgi:hypothetical protein
VLNGVLSLLKGKGAALLMMIAQTAFVEVG